MRETDICQKRTAVQFFKQFVRSFVTPYQQSQQPPRAPDVLRYLKPFSCEWLSRPEIALSEYSEAISSNMAVLSVFKKTVISKKVVKKLEAKFNPLASELRNLNRKSNSSPTSDNAKVVLKSIIDNDEEFDHTINNLFQAANAIFCIAANQVVARSLLRNPNAYSGIIEVSNEIGQEFQNKGDVKAMKRYLLQEFSTDTTNDTPTSDILRELDSTSEDSSSESISVSESSSESLTRSRKRKVIQETEKFSSSPEIKKVRKSPEKTPTTNRQPAEGGTSTRAKPSARRPWGRGWYKAKKRREKKRRE
ncbi:Hypothetical predicted protein [Paramuricea clavata]|uniref:Uncharacterized protein n=1 Tax=Paramuricea clavata TaxID=317549 RepID=A0A6S7FUI3_PARCT|nr:Hypothetical predicted protein [Paramuricea clavata]